jgi:hypothetical protein
MSNIQIFEQKDFTGGLNLRSDQYQLANNESPEMFNVEVDPRGGVFSRGGMQRINTTNVSGTWAPHRLFAFYGETNRLVLNNNNKISYLNGTVFTNIQDSSSVDIVTSNEHGVGCASWGSLLYMVCGVAGTAATAGYYWTGTGTATTLTASGTAPHAWQTSVSPSHYKIPQAEYIAEHANRMFVAHTVEAGVNHPNRLRWSIADYPNNWQEADYIDIEGGGAHITGICVVNGGLVIFKEYAIYYLYGYDTSDFRVVQISNDIGCYSPSSFAVTQQGVFFYSNRKGVYLFDGTNLQNIFEPLRPAYDLGYINTGLPEKVSLSWMGRRLWVSLPYDSSSNVAIRETINLVYDPSMGSYTMFSTADGYGVRGGVDFRTSTGEEIRVAIHPNVPCVLEVDKYDLYFDYINVDGTISGFSTVYRTKWFDGGSYLQRKMFRRPDLVMRETEANQTVNVKVFHDYQEAVGSQKREFDISLLSTSIGMLWDTNNWTLEGAGEDQYSSVWSNDVLGGSIQKLQNLGLAKTIQLRFSGEQKKPWGFNSIGYKWVPRRVKG